MTQLQDSTFEQETAQGVSIIDFWAQWCVPCTTVAPMYEAVASSHEDKEVKFFKSDVDACPELSSKFSIRSVPTFLVLKDGKEIGRFVGPTNLTKNINNLIEIAKQ